MAELFSTSRTNIVEHIGHIYDENELDAESTCRKFRQVQIEGSRKVNRQIPFYNLDMILSLGYRVKSTVATKFRRWANQVLKENMREVHDRFVIVDDVVYHVGASFKDLGNQMTAFSVLNFVTKEQVLAMVKRTQSS